MAVTASSALNTVGSSFVPMYGLTICSSAPSLHSAAATPM